MHTVIIERRESGRGSIYDVASEFADRIIPMRAGERFAVVLAAYYGGKGHRNFRSASTAARYSLDLTQAGIAHEILDRSGRPYQVLDRHWDTVLVPAA